MSSGPVVAAAAAASITTRTIRVAGLPMSSPNESEQNEATMNNLPSQRSLFASAPFYRRCFSSGKLHYHLRDMYFVNKIKHYYQQQQKQRYQIQRQLHSFWSWRGGAGDTDDGGDDLVESPQVSSFLLGSAAQKSNSKKTQASSTSSLSSSAPPSSPASAYPVSVCTAQGHRSYMEDEYFVSNGGDFAACFDGHGGRSVSKYLRKNLYANVQAYFATLDRQPTVDDYASSLEYALDKCDREVERISHWSFQGSTAIVVCLHETSVESSSSSSDATKAINSLQSRRTILAANIGDSRAVLCRNGTGWALSRDHKPNDPLERERIENQGGQVIWCGDTDDFGLPIEERGIYRVNGNLALSRAVGDRSEKPAVSAEPEIISVPVLDDEDLFILLATDGLWDVMDSQEAVSYILSLHDAKLSKKKIATQIVEEALRRGTYDNVTVVIIWLDGRQRK